MTVAYALTLSTLIASDTFTIALINGKKATPNAWPILADKSDIAASKESILSCVVSTSAPSKATFSLAASIVAFKNACFFSESVNSLTFFFKVLAYALFASSTLVIIPILSSINRDWRPIPVTRDSIDVLVSFPNTLPSLWAISNISAISSEFLETPSIIALLACWKRSNSDIVPLVASFNFSNANELSSVAPVKVLKPLAIASTFAASFANFINWLTPRAIAKLNNNILERTVEKASPKLFRLLPFLLVLVSNKPNPLFVFFVCFVVSICLAASLFIAADIALSCPVNFREPLPPNSMVNFSTVAITYPF